MSLTKITIIPPMYQRIMTKLPQNFTFGFAYGSRVKKQLNNDDKRDMIDLIFAVKDPVTWHEANLHINPSHYSFLKHFGHEFIARYQTNFGAKVYFNTLVQMDDCLVKYGVVANEDLITDLLEWSHLYLAGRLHKPVEIIKKPLDTELETALQLNLQSAVHAAFLILPETFSEYEFYHTISNLSYQGDFRMYIGENKNKVNNIVKAQMVGFRNLYKPFLMNLEDYIDFPMLKKNSDSDGLEFCAQDISPLARLHHLNQLPRWPQKLLTRYWNKGNFRQDTEDVLRAIAYDPDCGAIVNQRINEIVLQSSIRQSVKGILTAGILKSVKYSSRKIKKMILKT
ncbi:hypothetical protein ABEB36_008123 [Hypothenemus hampei]|uniref:Phosphatidate cytidylyltransferase, mitochondrial n=1 Tax=Hypothenemus hampei TaxID=57062 RepID=A0ABD1EKU7_HYPHA